MSLGEGHKRHLPYHTPLFFAPLSRVEPLLRPKISGYRAWNALVTLWTHAAMGWLAALGMGVHVQYSLMCGWQNDNACVFAFCRCSRIPPPCWHWPWYPPVYSPPPSSTPEDLCNPHPPSEGKKRHSGKFIFFVAPPWTDFLIFLKQSIIKNVAFWQILSKNSQGSNFGLPFLGGS